VLLEATSLRAGDVNADVLTEALVDALRPLVEQMVDERVRQLIDVTSSPRWLTVEEFAELHRATPGAIRQRAYRGQIAGAVKEGARWLIPDEPVTVPRDNVNGRAPRQRPRPGNRSSP
jgi:hypothetical protein